MNVWITPNPVAYPWRPDQPDDLGGTEAALVRLAAELAGLGHAVTVQYDGPALAVSPVKYVPRATTPTDAVDVHVCWNHPEGAGTVDARQRILWTHQERPVPPGVFDAIVALSPFHQRILTATSPAIAERVVVIPCGWDNEPQGPKPPARDPNLVLHTASPDRGLIELARVWPTVVAARPQARLVITQGWELYDAMGGPRALRDEINRLLFDDPAIAGTVTMGRVDRHALGRLYDLAGVWVYYCTGGEMLCQAALAAQMRGCVPVVRPWGALHDSVWSGIKAETPEAFRHALIEAIHPERQAALRRQIAPMAASWAQVAEAWDDLLRAEPATTTSRCAVVPPTPTTLLPNPDAQAVPAVLGVLNAWAQRLGLQRVHVVDGLGIPGMAPADPQGWCVGWLLEDEGEAALARLGVPKGAPVIAFTSTGSWRAGQRSRYLTRRCLHEILGTQPHLGSQCVPLDGEGNAVCATTWTHDPAQLGSRDLARVRATTGARETLSACFIAPPVLRDGTLLRALRSLEPIVDEVCIAINGGAPETPALDDTVTAGVAERWSAETGIPVRLTQGTAPRWCYDCQREHAVGELLPGHRLAGFETPRNQSLALATMDHVCFVPGTQIRTRGGFKAIEDVRIGDEVLTHRGRFRKVEQLHRRDYEGEIVYATPAYSSEPIGMTPNHPVLAAKNFDCYLPGKFCQPYCTRQWAGSYNQAVLRGERKGKLSPNCRQGYADYALDWFPAGDLAARDLVVYQGVVPERTQTITIDLAEWIDDSSEYVITKDAIRPRNARGKAVPRAIVADEGFWRLCGYYLSEGHTGRGNSTVGFSFHAKELAYHDDVREQIKRLFGLSSVVRRTHGNAAQITVSSKVLCQFFGKFLGEGADNKRLPDVALNIPTRHAYHILLGCMFGDGSVHPDSFHYVSNSRLLVHQLRDIMLRMGAVPGVRRHDRKRTRAWILSVGGRSLERLADFGLRHPFLDIRSQRHKPINQDGWTDGYRLYTALRRVTRKPYRGPVFNIGVDEDNSYTAEGVVVHNCWMDCDEVLCEPERLAKYLRPNPYEGYGLPQDHHSSDPPQAFKRDTPVRLFRRRADGTTPGWTTEGPHAWPTYNPGTTVKFRGIVHEHPGHAPDYTEGLGPVIVLGDVWIAHHGYLTEPMRRGRFIRNWPLMVADRQKYPRRLLGLFLQLRDLSHHVRYALERAGGRLEAHEVSWAEECIRLYEQEILTNGNGGQFLADAAQYAGVCYHVLGRGIEADVRVTLKKPEISGDEAVALQYQGRIGSAEQVEQLVKGVCAGAERWSGGWA